MFTLRCSPYKLYQYRLRGHVRNAQALYHLTTAEIIDLKNSGVSEKVIDFMINTPSAHR